jgi:hypothetical protein
MQIKMQTIHEPPAFRVKKASKSRALKHEISAIKFPTTVKASKKYKLPNLDLTSAKVKFYE